MNVSVSRVIVAVICCFYIGSECDAGIVVGNDIQASNPSASNPFTTGQVTDVNVSGTGIGRGSGINAKVTSNRYNATGWGGASIADAIGNQDFFTFTITPNAGFEVDFDDFRYEGQASGTGPNSFAFRSSVDSFGSNIGLATEGNTVGGTTISLAGSAFQNVTNAITFRFYGWGATNDSVGTYSINNFSFNGSISAVPEPTSLILVGMACAPMLLRRRTLVA